MFALRDFKKGDVETAPVIPVAMKNVVNAAARRRLPARLTGITRTQEYCMPLGYIMMYNHSKEPNIMLDQDYDKYTYAAAIALRDIKKGARSFLLGLQCRREL